uniref:Uncharacterized protein n=1 Tax=Timema douglasi TaxID=61478 RepID=A0A7R8VHT9_TIMDO|nr:unnamed protein product [Timema douglasi]
MGRARVSTCVLVAEPGTSDGSAGALTNSPVNKRRGFSGWIVRIGKWTADDGEVGVLFLVRWGCMGSGSRASVQERVGIGFDKTPSNDMMIKHRHLQPTANTTIGTRENCA